MKLRTTALVAAVAMAAAGLGAIGGFTAVEAAQPHMTNALGALQTAKAELQAALPDKGGHRVNALKDVNAAITETQAGIAVGAGM